MILSLIAAIGTNNALGKDNTLLWHLPDDFKHFKQLTQDQTIIMGRKTFESIGRALPRRRNIVITRDTTYSAEGIEIRSSLEDALSELSNTDEEVFIIGGGQIYKEAIEYADRLYITHVDTAPEADTFFPPIDPGKWICVDKKEHLKDTLHEFNFVFCTYIKNKKPL